MNFAKRGAWACALLLIFAVAALVAAVGWPVAAQTTSDQTKPSEVAWMAASELKEKVAGNEPMAIIDVRATDTYIGSDSKIKGAMHVRFRRLRTRLAYAPLKDIPRDRPVVIYCSCANDEASVRTAQVFSSAGFTRVRVLKGGWQAWLNAGGQVESKPKVQ
jgi:rhodanese-related sulfurtransferase